MPPLEDSPVGTLASSYTLKLEVIYRRAWLQYAALFGADAFYEKVRSSKALEITDN